MMGASKCLKMDHPRGGGHTLMGVIIQLWGESYNDGGNDTLVEESYNGGASHTLVGGSYTLVGGGVIH